MGIFSDQCSLRCTSEIINMLKNLLCAALLVAYAQAIHYDNHEALSTVTFNNHHNTVHHVHSAPVKTVAIPVHSAPAHSAPAAPAIHTSPLLHSLSSGQGSISTQHHVALPSFHFAPVAATPVHEAQAAPVHGSAFTAFSSGHSAPAGASLHIAPVVQAAPVVHAAPVFHAAPAVQTIPAVHAAPVVHVASAGQGNGHHHVEEYSHPKYEFAYGVEDHHTGDIHSHKESRDGDVTHGEYSLHEADGTVRTVKYTVDKHSGFNAVVQRTGHATHVQPAPHHH